MNLLASAGSYSVAGRISGMARPFKQLYTEPDFVAVRFRRGSTFCCGSTASVSRLLRLKTTPKRVSLWPRRFETLSRVGLDDKPGRGHKPSISLEHLLDEPSRRHLVEHGSTPQDHTSSGGQAIPLRTACIRKDRFRLGKVRIKEKTAPEIWNAVLAA
jgi:hypothetical protein